MQVFVSEYLTCGAWPGELADVSLATEGRAMAEALIADLARLPGIRVAATWDARLDPPRWGDLPVNSAIVQGPGEEQRRFQEFAGRSDATFVIAPEFHGILLARQRLVAEARGRWLGCSAHAIALCADKLRLAQHLLASGVPTIETRSLPVSTAEAVLSAEYTAQAGALPGGRLPQYPLVVKPRDGAGSQMTYHVAGPDELAGVVQEFARSDFRDTAIVQPYVPGRTVSVAALALPGGRIEVFPLAEQHLSDDGRFHYLGGRVRFPPPEPEQTAIESLVRMACKAVPGLTGYVGFDVILPDDAGAAPVLVEINPRLTTSYLGYRRLASGNLAERLVFPAEQRPAGAWRAGEVVFRPDGTTG